MRTIPVALAALAALAWAGALAAQDWPKQRPVTLLVGFGPGASTDLIARLLAPKLTEALGQSVVVENRGGAGGNIAAQQVKRAAPDGYTFFVTSVAYAVNPSLYANAGYDPLKDFVPVVLATSTPNIITVHPSVPAKNLQELIELARKEKLAYASSGIGTTTHLSMERIKTASKVDITHVPFQPAQAVGAAVGGQTQVSSTSMPPAVPQVKAGKLRPIAVTSAQRSPALPDVPDGERAGLQQFRRSHLVRVLRAGGHGARSRQPDERRDQPRARGARREGAAGAARARVPPQYAGRICRVPQGRSREVGAGGEGLRRKGRLTDARRG